MGGSFNCERACQLEARQCVGATPPLPAAPPHPLIHHTTSHHPTPCHTTTNHTKPHQTTPEHTLLRRHAHTWYVQPRDRVEEDRAGRHANMELLFHAEHDRALVITPLMNVHGETSEVGSGRGGAGRGGEQSTKGKAVRFCFFPYICMGNSKWGETMLPHTRSPQGYHTTKVTGRLCSRSARKHRTALVRTEKSRREC